MGASEFLVYVHILWKVKLCCLPHYHTKAGDVLLSVSFGLYLAYRRLGMENRLLLKEGWARLHAFVCQTLPKKTLMAWSKRDQASPGPQHDTQT